MPLSLKNGKSKTPEMKFAHFLCAKTTLGSARSIDYIRATLASCTDRDSSVKHVQYIGCIYSLDWTTGLISDPCRHGQLSTIYSADHVDWLASWSLPFCL